MTSPLPMVLVPHPHVRVSRDVLNGSPYIMGSRVRVRELYAYFKDGKTIEHIRMRYPQLGPASVLDALAFALDNEDVIKADLAREEETVRGG